MIRQIAERLEKIKEAQKDLTAKQLCPRCGINTISAGQCVESIVAPGVFICTECGNDELDFKEKNVPLDANFIVWKTLRPIKRPGSFENSTCEEAWKEIQKQQDLIFMLYDKAKAAATPDEQKEVEFEAEETLPGLENCCTEPFRLRYPTGDATVVLVMVRQDAAGKNILVHYPLDEIDLIARLMDAFQDSEGTTVKH